ncbi:cysteine desulfurase family protein [Planctomicrobium sp. SH664]|uniref:cysteine desulfurase family protein n=1 Tax=Planctomicrobium sp. SH664 TaxID=3448125 RepID=UPI003F5CAD6C
MIYLDNNASTRLDPEVAARMAELSQVAFGNPGSRHAAGRKARQILEDAREQLAELVDAAPEEVIFTSGGTESNHLAIHGLTGSQRGGLLVSPGEHPSVEEPVRRLVHQGWQRRPLAIDALGRLADCGEVSLDGIVLAVALLAHNETGVIQDLGTLAIRCREAEVPLHIDAVQAVGKIDVRFRTSLAASMSLAAHKFHGPRGIGALLLSQGCRLVPQMLGGHQEQGRRAGTESVVLAAGMAMALARWKQQQTARTEALTALRDRLQRSLVETCAPVVINGDTRHRLPNTLHLAFPGCAADALLVALDLAGICCSLGSACASGSTEPAPILLAMGLPREVYESSLRLSLSHENTTEEVDEAVRRIAHVVKRLRARER